MTIRFPSRRGARYAQASGVAWPDSGGASPAGADSIADVFGPRPFSSHIATVGYDYDFHRGIDVNLNIGDPVYSPIGGVINRWHFTHFGFDTDDHLAQWAEVDPGGRAAFTRVGTSLEVVGTLDGVQSFPTNCPYLTLGKRVAVAGDWAIELRCGAIAALDGAIGVAVIDVANGEYYALEYDGATLQTLGADSGGAIAGWDGQTDAEANITELRLGNPDAGGTIEAYRNNNDAGLTLLRSRSIDSFTAAERMEAILYFRSNAAGPGSETFTLDFVNVVTSETIGRFGNWVQVTDGSRRVAIMHMREILVAPGDIVAPGQQIGTIGKTGFDGRSGRINSAHAHIELINDNNYLYFNEEPVNPLVSTFLPRTNGDANVTTTVNESDTDPDAVSSISLDIELDRNGTSLDFDLNQIEFVGSSATRTVNFDTRSGLNADNDIPLEAGVYIEAFAFDENSATYRVKLYFHQSVVGSYQSFEVRDSAGTVIDSGTSPSNGFDDDFETAGALDSGKWTTAQLQSPDPDVLSTVSGGLYQITVDDNAENVNRSLFFGSAQGRLDYQTPGAGPWRFEAYACGAADPGDATTALSHIGASNGFQLCGIILHNPTLSTATYYGLFAGHRGGTRFTIEAKNNLSGSTSATDNGADSHSGFADLAIEIDGSGNVTREYRDAGDTTWLAAPTPFGNDPGLVTSSWVIGIVGYMFTEFKRDYIARVAEWVKVS